MAPTTVSEAVALTDEMFAAKARQAAEKRRLAREREEAEWRAAFEPHAVIQTARTEPSQITSCGLTGGIERWLIIRFDLTRPLVTFAQQALEAMPTMTRPGADGRRHVTFFGEALGFVVNYTPDRAIRFGLDGDPLEVLAKAYRPGEVTLSVGGRSVSPTTMARLLGAV